MKYVCGAEYDGEFTLVSAQSNIPYVAESEEAAEWMFSLVRHHAHLYKVDESMESLIIERFGDRMDNTPAVIHLTPALNLQIENGVVVSP